MAPNRSCRRFPPTCRPARRTRRPRCVPRAALCRSDRFLGEAIGRPGDEPRVRQILAAIGRAAGREVAMADPACRVPGETMFVVLRLAGRHSRAAEDPPRTAGFRHTLSGPAAALLLDLRSRLLATRTIL